MTGERIAATTAAIGARTAAKTAAPAGSTERTPEGRDDMGTPTPVLAVDSGRRAAVEVEAPGWR